MRTAVTSLLAINLTIGLTMAGAVGQPAAQNLTGSPERSAEEVSPSPPKFNGNADMPDREVADLFSNFGLTAADYPNDRIEVRRSIGFAIYDRRAGRMVRSFNLDESFNLASTTKLFTMAVVGTVFRGDPLLRAQRTQLARILRTSDNRGASQWLMLAHDRVAGGIVDVEASARRVRGACYGDRENNIPARGAAQKELERTAATAFFAQHKQLYRIDWTGARIVDGAGCERAGNSPGADDRATPRQYLTILDRIRGEDFAGWNALELLPQMSSQGFVPDHNVSSGEAQQQGLLAWKTGTDAYGIRNIAGFIPTRDDPFAFYFVLFINTGRSPPKDTGIQRGPEVVHGFAAWAARIARTPSQRTPDASPGRPR